MITLDCSKCGAPLEADENASFVTCKFCHSQTIVPNHNAQHAPYFEPSLGEHIAQPASASKRSPIVTSAIGLMVLMSAGLVVYGNLRGGRAGLGANRGVVYQACLVDANGDDTLDVAATRTVGDGPWYVELVDGVSGETRWHSERMGELTGLVCFDRHFVVAAKDFKTYVHDARAPSTPIVVQGHDVTRYVIPGEGCLSLRATDDSTAIVGMDGRALEACAPLGAELDVIVGKTGVLGSSDDDVTLPTGEQLLARETGTEVLSVRRSPDETPTELSLVKCDVTSAIAVNADTVFLHACAIGNDDDGMVVALKKSDLSERWRKPIAGISADNVSFFAWNGRVLVVQSFGAITTFDANGNSVWRMN